jgi:hypothetical protein
MDWSPASDIVCAADFSDAIVIEHAEEKGEKCRLRGNWLSDFLRPRTGPRILQLLLPRLHISTFIEGKIAEEGRWLGRIRN